MTAYDRVIDALETAGSKRHGRDWQCPAHDDGKPSLTVNEGSEGRVVMHCHAGCTYDEIIAALPGIGPGDLTPPEARANGHRRVLEEYTYTDETGVALFLVKRFHPKDFRQYKPDGTPGIQGIRRVLYRLPKVIAEAQRGGTVHISEGERDVHALERAGAVATTNPMGAGKWRDEYAQSLKGANVVVVADRDSIGYEHAETVAMSVRRYAASVRVVEAAEGKDAADHLRAKLGLEDFKAINGTAKPSEEKPPPAFSVLTARETCELPDPPEEDQLLGPLIVRGQRIVLGAHTGHGKTTFTLCVTRAITQAAGFLDWTGAGGRALIIDAEQGLRTIKRRLREAGLEDSDRIDYARAPDGLSLDSDQAHIEALGRQLETGGYSLVIADPLYKLHRGDSNEERAAIDLMRRFDAWREHYRFAFMLPVHCRKPPQDAKFSMHEFFGSTAYLRGAEVVIGLQLIRDGYSRLHFFKDRDGDLPITEKWGLLFDREEGYRRDPEDGQPKQTAKDKVRELLTDQPYMTEKQLMAATGAAERTVRNALKAIGAESIRGSADTPKRWYLVDEDDATHAETTDETNDDDWLNE